MKKIIEELFKILKVFVIFYIVLYILKPPENSSDNFLMFFVAIEFFVAFIIIEVYEKIMEK